MPELKIAATVLGPVEMVNRKLQSRTETVAEMMECAETVSNQLKQL
jgi:hypothetical protein